MATPGPDLLLLTRMATRSRRHALASVSGISTGLVLWVSLTVFGAAALLISYPVLESVIKLVGGVWLVWMGRGMILAARAQFRDRMNADIDVDTIFGTPWKSYQQGLFTNLSNPKVVLYFADHCPAHAGASHHGGCGADCAVHCGQHVSWLFDARVSPFYQGHAEKICLGGPIHRHGFWDIFRHRRCITCY